MVKTPKKSSDENVSEVYSQYDALTMLKPNFDANLDKIATECDLGFDTLDGTRRLKSAISSGLLSVDLATNGGYGGGRMSYIYGPSGAGKSTIVYHGVLSALSRQTRTCVFDHETCADAKYLENIGFDFSTIVGLRGKDGKWKNSPLYRYTEAIVAQETFKYIFKATQEFPYKVEMYDESTDESRYFLINDDFGYKKTWASINEGLKAKKIIEVEDFAPQGLFVIDSIKGMLPESKFNDPDANPMALLARLLAENFPMVKGLLAKRHCALVMTNHISINPAARWENPETEPGGNAVKFYPDLKLRTQATMTDTAIIVEPALSGVGQDRYRPGRIKIMKNKGGASFRSVEYRIWLDSSGKPGMGIDPVFDTYQFLDMTSQLGFTGKKKDEYKILIPGYDSEPLDWAKFKRLVLTDKKLRQACSKQIAEGYAQPRYYDWLANNPGVEKKSKAKKGQKAASDEEEDDDSVSDEELEQLGIRDSEHEVTV